MRPLLLSLCVLLLAGCSIIPVTVDYQPGYDFSAAQRYYWLPPLSEPPLPSVHNSELVTRRVAQAVETELQHRGIRPVDNPAEADLLVRYQIGIEKLVEIEAFMGLEGSHSLQGGRLGLGLLGGQTQQYQEGTWVIDLLAVEDQRLLWRGMAERRLKAFASPAEYDAFIIETVAAILKRYPPSP